MDCDGTLVRTDLLFESLFQLPRQSPLSLCLLPVWYWRGKGHLKEQIAKKVNLDVTQLPYHLEFLDYLRGARAGGRSLVLVTGCAEKYARKIADYLKIFDRVESTRNGINLTAHRKADRLVEIFGEGGFEYAGNCSEDLPIWRKASAAVLVNARRSAVRKAARLTKVSRKFERPSARITDYFEAMRLHQWLKNVLVFVPLLASHRVGDIGTIISAVLAFLAYGFCASSVYLLNDLLDLSADRAHPRKKHRPFASGRIPLQSGVILIPPLLVVAGLIGLLLPPTFLTVLALYYVMTLAYSLWLKNRVIVDVLVLTGLYTFRIIAGASATGIMPSFWLLAFSMFMFLSLALVKRCSELVSLRNTADRKLKGRGYRTNDLPVLMSLGTSSGQMAVLVIALYVNSPDVQRLYGTPELLWLVIPPMLFWVSRVWMKTNRGEMRDDPVVFAVRDPVGQLVAALVLAVLLVPK